MFLGKKQGASGISDYFWDKDGDVVEVPDDLGRELLASAPDEWFESDKAPAKKPRTNTDKVIVAE